MDERSTRRFRKHACMHACLSCRILVHVGSDQRCRAVDDESPAELPTMSTSITCQRGTERNVHVGSIRGKTHPLCHTTHIATVSTSGALEVGLFIALSACRFKRLRKHTAAPPVMFSPTSSALPAVETCMTRLAPLASSTTLPATSASMVTLRSMQSADAKPTL